MKASKFSDAQKAFILKQGADGMPVAEICRKAAARRHPPPAQRPPRKRKLGDAVWVDWTESLRRA